MATKNASSSTAALRYATALIETAQDAKAIDTIEKDLQDLAVMIAESEDLQKVLTSPLFSRTDQNNAMTALADKAKFHDLTKNFLSVLAGNRRLALLSAIIVAVQDLLAKQRGEVSAKVQSAYALSDKQTKELQESLSKAMGQNVTLDVHVNKDLIGGMVVTVGSKMIDDSVKRKLERLKAAMKFGANQNAGKDKGMTG